MQQSEQKLLAQNYDEEKYLEEQAEKRKSVSDLRAEIAMLENDDSAWAQKRIVEIKNQLTSVTEVLEELFVQNSRDRIIDFATKVTDGKNLVSREEFNRIFKVHAKYEAFLEDRKMTNGEVDVAILVIQESYAQHMKEHTFLEDVRGYSSKN